MDMTVKCPNCCQQVSREKRYCVFCGYDLEATQPVPGVEAVAPVGAKPGAGKSLRHGGPQYCPNGHDVFDPALGFCPVCGSSLVDRSFAPPAPPRKPADHRETPPPRAVMVCKCGYVCEDPDLSFCPACGLPFDTPEPVVETEWTCANGATNTSDMKDSASCEPGEWKPIEKTDPREAEDSFIPAGMKPPTDDDLEVKSRYGN